jgi:hypothetical protein
MGNLSCLRNNFTFNARTVDTKINSGPHIVAVPQKLNFLELCLLLPAYSVLLLSEVFLLSEAVASGVPESSFDIPEDTMSNFLLGTWLVSNLHV